VHLKPQINTRDMSLACTIPVCHHVQHSAELGSLAKSSCSLTVHRVQQTGYAVEQRAVLRVIAHVVKGEPCEDDTTVAWIAFEQRDDSLASKGATNQ